MPVNRLRISRGWRSTAVAIVIGLMAPLVVLVSPTAEALARRLPITGGVSLTAIAAFVDKIDSVVYDYMFEMRGPHAKRSSTDYKQQVPSIPQVVIVAIDDNGVSNIIDLYKNLRAQYPFPRRVYADLIRRLKRAGAVVVGIDIVFDSPSQYNRSDDDPDDDREFAKALRECGNVVLAASFGIQQHQNADFRAQPQDFPIAVLRKSARSVAPVSVPKDNLDTIVRRFYCTELGPEDPDLPTAGKQYPTFGPMIAALYWKERLASDPAIRQMPQHQFDALITSELEAGRFANSSVYLHRPDSQTAGESRTANICYAGFPGASSCAIWSIGDVLNREKISDDKLRAAFQNKIVLVGSWTDAGQDFYGTPLIPRAADTAESAREQRISEITNLTESDHRFGVDIHANIVHTLLAGHNYRDFDEDRRVALVWMCGLITALLVARLKPVLAILPITGLLAVIVWMVIISFSHFVFLRPVQIALTTVFAYGLESVYFYSVENRHVKRARSRFQRYVGPEVMRKVLDTDFKTGTVERRPVTLMFTDLQGFTSLSEKMDPDEAVRMLNQYIDSMVDTIWKYGGTLDKIMGDGLMAYFNAPFDTKDHEQKAVECALDMQHRLREWRALSEEKGVPPLKVRIGIHTGNVVVGDVGAKDQVGYTVIGDVVNTAARLEPLNKEFGTEILISEAVRSQLNETIETVYVGELEIRGREEGIRAYNVTGRRTAPPQV